MCPCNRVSLVATPAAFWVASSSKQQTSDTWIKVPRIEGPVVQLLYVSVIALFFKPMLLHNAETAANPLGLEAFDVNLLISILCRLKKYLLLLIPSGPRASLCQIFHGHSVIRKDTISKNSPPDPHKKWTAFPKRKNESPLTYYILYNCPILP